MQHLELEAEDDRRPYLAADARLVTRAVELPREHVAGIDGARRRPERGAGARLHLLSGGQLEEEV
jgi:hypothetical protein